MLRNHGKGCGKNLFSAISLKLLLVGNICATKKMWKFRWSFFVDPPLYGRCSSMINRQSHGYNCTWKWLNCTWLCLMLLPFPHVIIPKLHSNACNNGLTMQQHAMITPFPPNRLCEWQSASDWRQRAIRRTCWSMCRPTVGDCVWRLIRYHRC